ncbi:hypothetical protein [Anaerosolibacter sp.]|uniref:hypothetical protein n=1 Tax=Anaerosolibacter sp. TaxID=1872527 RepID=UPI0039EE3DCA
MKIHLLDRVGDKKVPHWNKAKKEGYRVAKCGYQRKQTSKEIDEVTCNLCLREYFKDSH